MVNISFADLTHTGQLIAANTFPLGISYVAATTKEHFKSSVNIDIFKYPDDFNSYLSKKLPDVACFSSFVWNIRLAHTYATKLKEINSNIITVFGGPHFPSESSEQKKFLEEFNNIDFYIEFEGEFNFRDLLANIIDQKFNLSKIKETSSEIPNLRFIHDNKLIQNEIGSKIKDINEIPSPYLMGMMDKFFDDTLIPVIQTNRGCPYKCSFCWEGGDYFNKIKRFDQERLFAEMDYIADRAKVNDLQITDANFGIFKEDLETAKKVTELQKSHNYPETILSATAKNHKERTIKIVEMLGDTLPATAAVQSTDEIVLKNINRGNVPLDTLMTMGKAIEKRGGQSEAELILCLEGDTSEKHKKTVYDMLDADMKFIRMYQFMMLLGTNSASLANRETYGIKTKYRVLPRCFGVYEIFDEKIPVAEIEEIVIANKTMPYEDYLKMRNLHLTVEIFNNDSIFLDLVNLLKFFNLKRSSFIERINNTIKNNEVFKDLYKNFNEEEYKNLSDKNNLIQKTSDSNIINKYINGELGTNELYKYRVIATFYHLELLHKLAYDEAKLMLNEKNKLTSDLTNYLEELHDFSLLRKLNPLTFETEIKNSRSFSYDFIKLMQINFDQNPLDFKLSKKINFDFYHSQKQKRLIETYFSQYGRDDIGLGRIVLRANMNRLHRSVNSNEYGKFEPVDEEYNKRQKQKMIA